MGVELKLMPLKGWPGFWLAHSMIDVDRNPGLFDALRAIGPTPVEYNDPPSGWAAGDDGALHYKALTVDCYDDMLGWLPAAIVAARMEGMDEVLSPWNRAVQAFLAALPPETRVVLYWH